MKLYFYTLSSALFLSLLSNSYGQKALEKEWAKKLKELKPLDYKALIEERDNLQKEVSDCSNSKTALRSESESKIAEAEKMKIELDLALKTIDSLKAGGGSSAGNIATSPSGGSDATAPVSMKGVLFKVQIGSFKNKDLTKYFQNNKNFSGEIDEDGAKKYTLGIFKEYWEADTFKKYLRDMGVKDAWIVSYKDGRRVNIKDALEGTL
jgi:intein/homing endonuclease